MRLSSDLSDQDCVDKFEKRFGKTVPLESVNLLLLTHNQQPLGLDAHSRTDVLTPPPPE